MLYAKESTWVDDWGTEYYIQDKQCISCPEGTKIYQDPYNCETCTANCREGYCRDLFNMPYCLYCEDNYVNEIGKCQMNCSQTHLYNYTDDNG